MRTLTSLIIVLFAACPVLGQYPPAPVVPQYTEQAIVQPQVIQYAQQPQIVQQPQIQFMQAPSGVCPNCGRIHAQGQAVNSGGLIPGEINRNPAAFAHARREAAILAQQGDRYPNRRDGGHPLGPGGFGRRGGTGVSLNGQPNHCYDTAPQSQIVARAAVRGNWRGRPALFWSAILR